MTSTTGGALLRGTESAAPKTTTARRRHPRYEKQDQAFADPTLNDSTKATFKALVDRSDNDGRVFPLSQNELARKRRKSERSIRTHLRPLVQRGYLEVTKERVPGSKWLRNVYRINFNPLPSDHRQKTSGSELPLILLPREPREEKKEEDARTRANPLRELPVSVEAVLDRSVLPNPIAIPPNDKTVGIQVSIADTAERIKATAPPSSHTLIPLSPFEITTRGDKDGVMLPLPLEPATPPDLDTTTVTAEPVISNPIAVAETAAPSPAPFPKIATISAPPPGNVGQTARIVWCDSEGALIPIDWRPSSDDAAYANAKGLGERKIAQEAEDFRNWYRERQITVRSPAEAWRRWINKLESFARLDRQRSPPASNGISPVIDDPTIWVAQVDPNFSALARRYAEMRGVRGVPIDKRGGWRFPKQWIATLTGRTTA